jgi:hypothetical protein
MCNHFLNFGVVSKMATILKGEEFKKEILENKHISQIEQYEDQVSVQKIENLNRILNVETDPRLPYKRRNNDLKSVVHWGQRKLLMAEIEFLTIFGQVGDLVVYAGAAPGNHINFLSLLFPFVRFVLVDPRPFACVETERIFIRQELFTDKLALEFERDGEKGRLLFISDIRSADWQQMPQEEVEASVAKDMEDQMRWHLMMKSRRSMLKFRLPWESNFTEYLDGDVFLPVWGPSTTTEARLIAGSRDLKIWDNLKYLEQMFYFNVYTRTQIYSHDVKAAGLCQCFDCASEVMIWTKYMRRYPRLWDCASFKMNAIFQARRFDKSKSSHYPGAYETALLSSTESWESDSSLWANSVESNISNENSRSESAIELTNMMCSKFRTLKSAEVDAIDS